MGCLVLWLYEPGGLNNQLRYRVSTAQKDPQRQQSVLIIMSTIIRHNMKFPTLVLVAETSEAEVMTQEKRTELP